MRGRIVIAVVSLGMSFAQWPARGAGGEVDFRKLEKVLSEELKETNTPGAGRIDLFVRDGKLIRKEFYETSVEEGPGREFEVPVSKIGRDRFVFTPPGSEAEDIQFTVIRGEDGKPEFLHGNLEAAARVTTTAP